MKILYSTALVALLSLFLADVSPVSAAEAKTKKIPFHGKLEAVDTSAQTITIAGKTPRVFHLTPETKITDGAGNASTLAAATVGEDVGGSYSKDAAGTMTLFSVRFGAKTGTKTASTTPSPTAAAATSTPAAPAPAPTPAAPSAAAPEKPATTAPAVAEKAKKQHFTGKVVSVDSAASTVVVHGKADQTFTADAGTKFTGATDLSGLKAGDKVSGTYTKSADGATLTLATLKVGK